MAAPKGNKYAEGHGRPPIHTDPKEVDTLIADYFEWIEGEFEITEEVIYEDEEGNIEKGKQKKWIRHPEPPTVTGLSLHLGFCDKTSLYDYKEKESFSHSIKKAISRIEKFHEIAITRGDKCVGNIFALKNFGWTDRSEIDHNIDFK
jgi:hypothetical protein